MNRRELLTAAGLAAPVAAQQRRAVRAPMNILWITAEDMGPQIGCYGYPLVSTPNLDRLAAEGTRFSRAFVTCPVCSPSRSAFNTGMYQTTIGAHNHRSHRNDGYRLPEGVRLISHRLRDRGYFTANVKAPVPGIAGTSKTDFNFNVERPFDGDHWNQRKPGQSFFAHLNFQATHKGPAFPEARRQKDLIDPAKVRLPPYYADDPIIRDEFANYLDCVNLLDGKIGRVLDGLEKEGLAENTAMIFFADNGRCLIRGKQWCYDAGMHVPLIVRWPGVTQPGSVREDPVSMIDMSATTLAIAGIEPPRNMQGQVILGPGEKQRDYVFAARDRCDMTVDRVRAIRTRNYKYIRNFMPERPYTQYNAYIEKQYPTLGVMKKLHREGKLKGTEPVFMQPRKPEEELYDVMADAHEVNNLASSERHQHISKAMRSKLDAWIEESNDQGRIPEPNPPTA